MLTVAGSRRAVALCDGPEGPAGVDELDVGELPVVVLVHEVLPSLLDGPERPALKRARLLYPTGLLVPL